jgi:hypothetical protein
MKGRLPVSRVGLHRLSPAEPLLQRVSIHGPTLPVPARGVPCRDASESAVAYRALPSARASVGPSAASSGFGFPLVALPS